MNIWGQGMESLCRYSLRLQKTQKRGVGSAFVVPKIKVGKKSRISDCLSVYTGEMFAIIMAMRWISKVKISKAIVCSDSSAVLISLNEQKSETRQEMIIEIMQETIFIRAKRYNCKVPAHIGLRGNEEADKLAKKPVEQENSDSIQWV